jgi:hypothetical protein
LDEDFLVEAFLLEDLIELGRWVLGAVGRLADALAAGLDCGRFNI